MRASPYPVKPRKPLAKGLNRRALELALRRHYDDKFQRAEPRERERLRSGFETTLFCWHGELILVHSKGWVFYQIIPLRASLNGPLKKLAEL